MQSTPHITPGLELILSRLRNVRKDGKGFYAHCPAHGGSEKSTTLNLTATDDGRVLVHCFAGCASLDIVHAIGLELKDLFPARERASMTWAQKKELRDIGKMAKWKSALEVLCAESAVVEVASWDAEDGYPLNEVDKARLKLARARIAEARDIFDNARSSR